MQDKRWARAMALVKLPRDRSGQLLPPTVLASERLASELGRRLGLSVNEVLLCRLDNPAWGDAQGMWASLHCLVPEPFQRLDELPEQHFQDIWSGSDRQTLANDDELRAVRLFDQLILNGDRHGKNVLVSGGRMPGRLWAYFIDHAYAFKGPIHEAQLVEATEGKKLRRYIEEGTTLRTWWDGLPEPDQAEILPFARRIAELGDEEVKRLVRALPGEVASESVKRVMLAFLRHHVSILRAETA